MAADSGDELALLPRLAQLGTAMNRGRIAQQATEATGLALDRPAMTILLTLSMADTPSASAKSRTACRSSAPTSPARSRPWNTAA